MTAVLLRRLLRLLVVGFGISLITFLLLHLSGDPVAMILPEATEADRATLRETLGLNRPLLVQYGSFIGRAVQGDFGQSFFHRAPALPLVFERMAEALGFDGVWFAEHRIPRFAFGNPAVFMAAVARMTSRIRLGTAVSLLPLHNPVRLAEDYSMVKSVFHRETQPGEQDD